MEERRYTLNDVPAVLGRRKKIFLIPFVGLFFLSLLTALALPSIYRSTATILIEQREIPDVYVTSSITTFAEQRIQSIQQRILTSERLQALIERFSLYPKLKKRKTRQEVVERMREDIHLEPVNVEIADRRSGRTATATIAFSLSYDNPSPDQARKVADTITSLFLKEDLKVRKAQASSAFDFLAAERDKLQERINRAEKELALFKRKNILILPEVFQSNLQTLGDARRRIDRDQESLRLLKEKKEEMEDRLSHTEKFFNQLVREKDADIQKLELLELQLIDLKTRYSDRYPDVRKVKQEIAELRKKVDGKPENSETDQKNPAYITLSSRLAGLVSEIASMENQIKGREVRVQTYRKRLDETPLVEETYNALLADRQNLYTKYADLQAKIMEAGVAQEFESKQKGERFTLVEAAQFPEAPVKPNRFAIILIGLFAALGISSAAMTLAEFSDTAFLSGEDLRSAGVHVLAEIPVIVTREDRRRNTIRRCFILGLVVAVLAGLVLAFHTYVMDLAVLKARILRQLSLYI